MTVSLKLAVQQYEWGIKGESALVARLAFAGKHIDAINPNCPYAELWMGSHPNGPSQLETGETLPSFLASQHLPELPFLFKVLSVGQALSIQSHPNASLARQLHAARPQVYKDANPKPEMAIALTAFSALLGFRTWSEITASLAEFPDLARAVGTASLAETALSDADKTRFCYTNLMRLDTGTVTVLIGSVLASGNSKQPLVQLVQQLQETYPGGDVGVLSVFFLNFLELSPGEAIFIPADTPHAYLAGEILECMQNSDNVIRGGLTPKFKDVDVLIESLNYSPFQGERVLASNCGDWKVWRPLDLFGVTQIASMGMWNSATTAIGIIIAGTAFVNGEARTAGWAGVFLPKVAVEISECSADFVMYVADSL